MSKFSSETIARVREAVRLEDWVGRTVALQRRGRRYVGLCPFHSERTPSFSVSPDRQLFHCFGCQAGGDLFGYVMRLEGVGFPEAVRMVAEAASIPLPEERSADPEEHRRRAHRDALLSANALALEHFRANLEGRRRAEGRDAALAYLLDQRGLSEPTVDRFELGWAPADWQDLTSALEQGGVRLEDALELGLLGQSARTGRPYDRLRGRLVFPIRLPGGRVAGFGARRADWVDPDGPKYLNSPESAVYDKSKVLYGLHQARDAIRKRRQALVVEGYLDVILLAQSGFEHVVAGCGTALTEVHAKTLARLTQEVVTLYDGDAAGRRATHRAAGHLLAAGCQVRVVPLPEGQDPDDLVRSEGAEALRKRIDEAPGAIDYFLGEARAAARGGGVAGTQRALDAVTPLLRLIPDDLHRDVAIDTCARQLGVDRRTLARHLGGGRGNSGPRPGNLSHSGRPATQHSERRAAPLPHVVEIELAKLLVDAPETMVAKLESAGAFRAFSSEPVKALAEAIRQGERPDSVTALARLEADPRTDARWIGAVRERLLREEEQPHDADELIRRLVSGFRRRRVGELRGRLAECTDEAEQQALLDQVRRIQSGEI